MRVDDPNRLKDDQCVIGQVVSLRSGGPDMTISAVAEGEIECVWFDKSGRLTSHMFRREVLQPGAARNVMILPPCPECKRYAPPPMPKSISNSSDMVN